VNRPHAGHGLRRSLKVWSRGRSFFFLRGHWSCPWQVEYFAVPQVPELGYEGPTQWDYYRMATKPELRQAAVGQLRAADPGLMLGEFPRVTGILLDLQYDSDGSSRMPGTLMVRPSSGLWLLILKDPSSALQVKVQGQTFEDSLAALELLLESPDCPWEHDPYAPAKKPGKKK
jgi:hypothetical protein